MNPYLIIGFIVALALAGAGGFASGHHVGENDQKVADQSQFDGINKQLADQKTEAAEKLKTANEENLALMVERDTLKTNLEKQREDNRKATDLERAKYAGIGLRFKPAENRTGGSSGGCAQGTASDAASADVSAAVELPRKITSDLRQLAYDADTLADEYRKCYGYVQQVK